MVLTAQQRASVANIMNDPLRSEDWEFPWDDNHCDKMKGGGPPLKVTEEAWPRPVAVPLRRAGRRTNMQHPTWLTPSEIETHRGVILPNTAPVEVVVHGRPTPIYNVGQVEGLPEEMYRHHWEIQPVSTEHRNPTIDSFVSTLDVTIHHSVEAPAKGSRAAYLLHERTIRLPPFEMFYTSTDYYLSLAHELTHWAADHPALVDPTPDPENKWWELVAEFGAMFICADWAVRGAQPTGAPADYIEYWRTQEGFNDAEILHAAETAAPLATWVCRISPEWRTSGGETRWHPPQGDQSSRSATSPLDLPASAPRAATLEAAASARAFVNDVEVLGKMDPRKEPDAWERRATHLLESARQIDLTIPAVEAAIEAAVAIATPLDTTPVTAATWITDFQERTMRILAMKELVRSANKRTTAASPTRSITS